MRTQREILTKKITELDDEIRELTRCNNQKSTNITIHGSEKRFTGDTAKLLIGCAINALSSQRNNYLEQLERELSIRCKV